MSNQAENTKLLLR